MGCKGCKARRGRNQGKSITSKLTKCSFCGGIDVPLPLKEANRRGNKVICKDCILKGVGL